MTNTSIGIIAVVGIALLLAACGISRQQASQIATAVTQATAIQQDWNRVEEIYETHRGQLQADRREKVDAAMTKLSGVVSGLDDTDPGDILRNVDQAREMYRQARDAYKTLRPIAKEMVERGDINGDAANLLARLDERARDLDSRIDELGNGADASTVEALGVIRDVVPVVGRLIISLT